MAYTYSKLAETTVGAGGASSIVFRNIPQNYTDLFVRFFTRSSTTIDYGWIEFNSSTSNFSGRRMFADTSGGTVASQVRTDSYIYPSINPSSTGANTFGCLDLYIPNYTSNNPKSISAEGFYENNAAASGMVMSAGLWNNATAINSVSFVPASGTFVQYSSASLYGIRVEL